MSINQYAMTACALAPMALAPAAYCVRRKRRVLGDIVTSLICLAVLALAALVFLGGEQTVRIDGVFLLGLSFGAGGFKSIFGLLCAFMFFMSALANTSYFEGEPHSERYSAFLLLTLGGIMGVFYSGDLFTTYIFFEIMSVASWVWVAHNETKEAQKAADTYLAMAMIGGLTMLYGLIALYNALGTLDFAALPSAVAAYGNKGYLFAMTCCLLVGFGVKVGMYPFHVWLPKAYPVAPAPSSALLSGILTKSGVFGILATVLCLMWGNMDYALLILALGVVTMVLGAVLAVFSIDLKRTLACSSLSQIGFILVGVAMLATGEDVDLAAGGVMLHAVNHGLIKFVLFLSAGVIYQNRHSLDLNTLKGCGRQSPYLKACFAIGALSIAGVPLFGGYVSKTLLHEGIVEHIHAYPDLAGVLGAVEWLFLISGGLTAAYMTKLFVKLFVQKPDTDVKPLQMDKKTAFAIGVPSAALVVMGCLPGASYEKIAAYAARSLNAAPFSVAYFSPENLKGAAISLAIGAAVYFLFIRGLLTNHRDGKYVKATAIIELEDDIYRPLVNVMAFVGAFAARMVYSLTDWFVAFMTWLLSLGASQRVSPGEDHHFARYSKQYVKVGAISQTLQFELMLFGIGVVVTLAYLLLF